MQLGWCVWEQLEQSRDWDDLISWGSEEEEQLSADWHRDTSASAAEHWCHQHEEENVTCDSQRDSRVTKELLLQIWFNPEPINIWVWLCQVSDCQRTFVLVITDRLNTTWIFWVWLQIFQPSIVSEPGRIINAQMRRVSEVAADGDCWSSDSTDVTVGECYWPATLSLETCGTSATTTRDIHTVVRKLAPVNQTNHTETLRADVFEEVKFRWMTS